MRLRKLGNTNLMVSEIAIGCSGFDGKTKSQVCDEMHHAGECIKCGACEERCPFGVPIRDNMVRATEIFGK